MPCAALSSKHRPNEPPLWPIELPWPCSNAVYEDLMSAICRRAVAEQITKIAFGDLFLQDTRAYRERQLQGTGLAPLFPIWASPTPALASEMIQQGVKAKITCLDPSKLDRSSAGREFDTAFLEFLPPGVDPCGENGEFTPLYTTRRPSRAPFLSRQAMSWSATASSLPTSSRKSETEFQSA